MVRIPIPEALQRHFGPSQDVPQGQEEFFRWNLNNALRNAEVETLRRDAKSVPELRQQLDALRQEKLRLEAIPAASVKFQASPKFAEIQARLASLRQAEADGFVAEGTAAEYQAAVMAPAQKQFEDAEITERTQAVEREQEVESGRAWIDDSWNRMQGMPAEILKIPEFETWWGQEIQAFDGRLARGEHPEIQPGDAEGAHKQFMQYMKARLLLEPTSGPIVLAHLEQLRRGQEPPAPAVPAAGPTEQQRIEAAAAELRRKELEQAAINARTNPLGGVPPAIGARTSGDAPRLNAKAFDRMMSKR